MREEQEIGRAIWWSRRARRRAWRAAKPTIAALAVFVIALGIFASLPSSTMYEIRSKLHRHFEELEDAVRPSAERTNDWLDKPVSSRRDSHDGGNRRMTVSGSARIIDGDTMDVRGTRIRLFGIDAPERKQTCRVGSRRWACGQRAARALHDRIGNRSVRCEERDRETRIVAICRAGTVELNQWMVLEGWALAYRQYSRSYVDEENRARAAKRGVWRGEFVPPWDWRRGKRLPGVKRSAQKSSGGCRIKGNISESGKRIYHIPGGRFYEKVRVDTWKGERWFCNASEARRAGWRRSRE